MYDYFYGAEADQFSFYRISKVGFVVELLYQGSSGDRKLGVGV